MQGDAGIVCATANDCYAVRGAFFIDWPVIDPDRGLAVAALDYAVDTDILGRGGGFGHDVNFNILPSRAIKGGTLLRCVEQPS